VLVVETFMRGIHLVPSILDRPCIIGIMGRMLLRRLAVRRLVSQVLYCFPVLVLLGCVVLASCVPPQVAIPRSASPEAGDLTLTPVIASTSESQLSQQSTTPTADGNGSSSSATSSATPMSDAPATPRPTAEPSATPTARPLPTATPTPTVPPELAEGKQLKFNGDYGAARKEFASVGREAEDEFLLLEARYALAECYYLDGLHSEAVAVLVDLLDETSQSVHRTQVLFMLGESYAETGLWLESAQAFTQYLEGADTVLADLVQGRIAYAYRKAGRITKSETAYEAAIDASVSPPTTRALLRELGGMLVLQGDYAAALTQYERLAGLAETSYQEAEAELRRAEVLLLMGEDAEAEEHLRTATLAEPTSPYAYEALIKLVDAELPVDSYLRGLIDFHNGAYLPAIDAFHAHLDSGSEEKIAETRDMLARSYQALGAIDLALIEWDRLIDAYPESDLWGETWLQKARLIRSEEGLESGKEIVEVFLEEDPDHANAPEAVSLIATWEEASGDHRAAATYWSSLREDYPDSDLAGLALMQAAINEYRSARYRQAEEHLSDLRRQYPGYRPHSTLLWLGKALLARGSKARALDAWEELIQVAPESYSSARARELALEAGLSLQSTDGVGILATASTGRSEVEDWLREWVPAGSSAFAPGLPIDVSEDAGFLRGLELLEVGERYAGLGSLELVVERWWDDPWALFGLAEVLRDLDAFRLSIMSATRVIDLSPAKGRSEAPRYLLEVAYPTYYSDLVLQEAKNNDIDPLLLYAIIRQESLFESGARSHAAAQGLMQVIPDTGDWVST